MPGVVITGGNGFLGWHTRAALRAAGRASTTIPLGERFELEHAAGAMDGASLAIHIAGVNRGPEDDVRNGNLAFAQQFAEALERADRPPERVVFANSIQSRAGGVYGDSKRDAADIVRTATDQMGIPFVDVILPNLFGEHGRPYYNAVTSTFCHQLARGEVPTVDRDSELTLLHAQDAADLLTGKVPLDRAEGLQHRETVRGLLSRLEEMRATYERGEVPDIASKFDRDLFNTFRSYTFPEQAKIPLTRHADHRGSFFEIVRSHGGGGQSSFSTTVSEVSRGDHFHRRKIERFTVLAGTARIALRRLFSNEVLEFDVAGDSPVAIDMPTMWAHKITNTSSSELFTSFWSNEVFDPASPDTIAEEVYA